jgi:hypothetical protein
MRGSAKALVVCGALITSGLGAAAPAAASAAVPSCRVTFEGTVSDQWNNPAKWSTGQVPGPHSDLCITSASPQATGTIDIHSLQVEAGTDVDFGITQGVSHDSASVTISDILTDTSDSFVLLHGTLTAGTIENPGDISTWDSATITSPALSNTGTIDAGNSTLRLTDNPLQLHNGTLTGGTLQVSAGPLGDAIILNGGISSITAGAIDLAPSGGGSIENHSGGNALASLSSIGHNATLIDDGPLTVNGNLTSQGTLEAFDTDVDGNLVAEGLFEAAGVDVTGDYTQTSAATLEEGFNPAGTTIPGLSIGQTATLSGTFDIGVHKTCTPKDGTTATAITFAARNGTFTTTGSGFNVAYGATSVQVQYEGPVDRNGCYGG